ncbi:hypothetical protein Ciccas_009141 [Cichlidogyrus casuarinus]|uniref:Uncharacterized protein n=1 Tax=Cichlidogyrus casuarinus TaxID=1844966 RepID=A0ABD2PXX4_9PLAT
MKFAFFTLALLASSILATDKTTEEQPVERFWQKCAIVKTTTVHQLNPYIREVIDKQIITCPLPMMEHHEHDEL